MSSIGSSSDPSLTRTGLTRLDGQVGLDDLRRRDQRPETPETGLEPARVQGAENIGAGTDPGEALLTAAAWDGFPDGQRLLAGDAGLAAQLQAMPLSAAADAATDAVLAAID